MTKLFFRSLLLGLATYGLSGCTIDTSATADDVRFSCATNDDCEGGFECVANVCERRQTGTPDCIDNDNDGYGVGTLEQRQTCRECVSRGRCEEDCNDNDASIHPYAPERCNGADDNCNGEIDEPTPCADEPGICSNLGSTLPANTNVGCGTTSGVCEVLMSTQFCTNGADPCPCNALPVACEGGSYPVIPGPMDCLQ